MFFIFLSTFYCSLLLRVLEWCFFIFWPTSYCSLLLRVLEWCFLYSYPHFTVGCYYGSKWQNKNCLRQVYGYAFAFMRHEPSFRKHEVLDFTVECYASWEAWRLMPPATRLFVRPIAQVHNKESIEDIHHGTFMQWINLKRLKGTIMQEQFPYHIDIRMIINNTPWCSRFY